MVAAAFMLTSEALPVITASDSNEATVSKATSLEGPSHRLLRSHNHHITVEDGDNSEERGLTNADHKVLKKFTRDLGFSYRKANTVPGYVNKISPATYQQYLNKMNELIDLRKLERAAKNAQ